MLISVITSTFNAAQGLPLTIESIRRQTFSDLEWLVVDGGSTDGTVSLLEAEPAVSWWISEPDAGIYDAWNKACRQARGEWLLFIGAGDELVAPDTLARCAEFLATTDPDVLLVYGECELVGEQTRSRIEVFGMPWAQLQDRWEIGRPALPPHGATFQRRAAASGTAPFDQRFAIAADSHFLLRLVRRSTPRFIPLRITRTPIGGVSFRADTAHRVAAEITAINRDLGIHPPWRHRLTEWLRLTLLSLSLHLPTVGRERLLDFLRRLNGKPRRWSVR